MYIFAIHWRRFLFVFVVGLALIRGSTAGQAAAPIPRTSGEAANGKDERTALDNYVATPDPNYSFHLVKSVPGTNQTTFILEMTSQAWLTTNEVDRPLWKHWVIIVKPDSVTSSQSFLFISGGANDGKSPKSADGNMLKIALATKSVVSEL